MFLESVVAFIAIRWKFFAGIVPLGSGYDLTH